MLEIERKFIGRLTDTTALGATPSSHIQQAYLNDSDPVVRIRRLNDFYLMTIKSGSGMVRREVEFPVPAESGKELFMLAGDRKVEKQRYGLGRWEVDLFAGKLEGLMLIEIELTAEDEPLPPIPARIDLVKEVTGNPVFANAQLAELNAAEAKDLLERVERICSEHEARSMPLRRAR